MTLNRSTWISITIAAAICGGTLIWQRGNINAMSSEIEALKIDLVERPSGSTEQVAKGGSPSALGGNPDSKQANLNADRPSLDEIVATMPRRDPANPQANFRQLPEMLEQFADFSVDEIFAVLDEFEILGEKHPDKAEALGFAHSTLMMVVADAEPERLLAMAEERDDHMLRTIAFPALMRKDANRARDILADAKWTKPEIRMAKSALMGELVKQDLPAALEYMRENEADFQFFGGAVIAAVNEDVEVRESLRAALHEVESEVIQTELARGLVLSEYMQDGLSGARAALAEASYLDDESRLSIINETVGSSLRSDPDESYQWIRESLPPEQSAEALTHGVRSWAEHDFNAAGTWLGTLDQSPERDHAMGAFAVKVSRLDPSAAATWAIAIGDESVRNTSLGMVLSHWQTVDPEAMNTWALENEVPLDQIPQVLRPTEE